MKRGDGGGERRLTMIPTGGGKKRRLPASKMNKEIFKNVPVTGNGNTFDTVHKVYYYRAYT